MNILFNQQFQCHVIETKMRKCDVLLPSHPDHAASFPPLNAKRTESHGAHLSPLEALGTPSGAKGKRAPWSACGERDDERAGSLVR